MPRNSARVRSDLGAPPQEDSAGIEADGGKEVRLTAIHPDGGHQRSGSEVLFSLRRVGRGPGKLVNDHVDDVLGDVHRVEI